MQPCETRLLSPSDTGRSPQWRPGSWERSNSSVFKSCLCHVDNNMVLETHCLDQPYAASTEAGLRFCLGLRSQTRGVSTPSKRATPCSIMPPRSARHFPRATVRFDLAYWYGAFSKGPVYTVGAGSGFLSCIRILDLLQDALPPLIFSIVQQFVSSFLLSSSKEE